MKLSFANYLCNWCCLQLNKTQSQSLSSCITIFASHHHFASSRSLNRCSDISILKLQSVQLGECCICVKSVDINVFCGKNVMTNFSEKWFDLCRHFKTPNESPFVSLCFHLCVEILVHVYGVYVLKYSSSIIYLLVESVWNPSVCYICLLLPIFTLSNTSFLNGALCVHISSLKKMKDVNVFVFAKSI